MADDQVFTSEVNEVLAELSAKSLISTLVLKRLIADFAAENRSPRQAATYVENLREGLLTFTKFANEGNSKMDTYFENEMNKYIELLFSGITFDRE